MTESYTLDLLLLFVFICGICAVALWVGAVRSAVDEDELQEG